MIRLWPAILLAAGAQDPVEHTRDTLDAVKAAMAKNEAVFLDVREKKEWDEGHLDGAMFLPLSWLREESTGDQFADRLAERVPKKKILYLYCRSGRRVLAAASILRKQGYDARPLKAGFEQLRQAGFSVEK